MFKGAAFIKGKKVHSGNTELWKEIGCLVEIPYSGLRSMQIEKPEPCPWVMLNVWGLQKL